MSKTLKRRTNSKKRLVKRNKKHTNMRKTKNVKRRRGGYGGMSENPSYKEFYGSSQGSSNCNSETCYHTVDSVTKRILDNSQMPHIFRGGVLGMGAKCINQIKDQHGQVLTCECPQFN